MRDPGRVVDEIEGYVARYGVGSRRTLDRIKKRVDLDDMAHSMRAAFRSGLNIKANIIVGFPGEGHLDILRSIRWVARMAWLGVHDVSLWPFSPYPGSELYEVLRRAGRIGRTDDEYFASLLAYSDLWRSVSYDENVGSTALQAYRLLGWLVFYGLAFLLRPVRLFRTLRNLFTDRHESRLEMALANLVRRRRATARRPAGVG